MSTSFNDPIVARNILKSYYSGKPASTQKFNGKNVFLALRTDIFHGVEDEHLTLKFLGNYPYWDFVIGHAKQWQSILPVAIKQNGIAIWKNRDLYHEVALMTFEGHPSLFGRNWHITLDSSAEPMSPRWWTADNKPDQVLDELWVGYKDSSTGEKKWISYRNAKHMVKSGNK